MSGDNKVAQRLEQLEVELDETNAAMCMLAGQTVLLAKALVRSAGDEDRAARLIYDEFLAAGHEDAGDLLEQIEFMIHRCGDGHLH